MVQGLGNFVFDIIYMVQALGNFVFDVVFAFGCYGFYFRFQGFRSRVWNQRLGGLQAALGSSQIKNLEKTIIQKENQGQNYQNLLHDYQDILQLPLKQIRNSKNRNSSNTNLKPIHHDQNLMPIIMPLMKTKTKDS